MIKDLLEDLIRDEGFRAHAYRDSEGYWTIGYGTLIDDRFPESGLSRQEATALLTVRAQRYIDELDTARPEVRQLPPGVRRALYNMAYNLGVPGLLKFRKMWRALGSREWSVAAEEALDSKWARQVGDRSKRIADLIRKGE